LLFTIALLLEAAKRSDLIYGRSTAATLIILSVLEGHSLTVKQRIYQYSGLFHYCLLGGGTSGPVGIRIRLCCTFPVFTVRAKRGLAIACRLSVCLTVCDVGGLGPHRLKNLETNCANN